MTLADAAPRLNPLSRDFVWQDRPLAAPRRLTPAQKAAFDELGYIKLEGVFDAREIAAVTAAISSGVKTPSALMKPRTLNASR